MAPISSDSHFESFTLASRASGSLCVLHRWHCQSRSANSCRGCHFDCPHIVWATIFGGFRTLIINESPTSARAEACAMLLACWSAVQLAAQHPHHITGFDVSFTYDSYFAGKVAAGQWKAKKHLDVLKPARALILWIQAIPNSNIEWHYVPSHSSHPYNEAADSACWAAMCGRIPSIDSEVLVDIVTFDHDKPHLAEWLWFLEATLHGRPGLPRLGHFEFLADAQSSFEQDPDGSQHPFIVRTTTDQLPAVLEPAQCTLRCATANVLTLYHDNQRAGAYISARQEELMDACHQARLLCIGIQESRSRLDGHVLTTHYHVLAAPATTRGVGGVQLWIARKWPASKGTLDISSDDIRILHSSSQRLVVKIACAAVRLVLIVLHAPSSQDPHALEAWWNATANAIPGSLRSWQWIVLADANSRVGSITSEAVGTAGAQEENEAGSSFHAWLLRHGLHLPQTFEDHHPDALHATWVHGTGTEARLDYIAIPRSLHHDQMHTQVGEVDLSLHGADHRMVSISLPWALWQAPCTKPSRATASQELPAPCPAWNDNIHSHAGQIQAWVASTLPARPRRKVSKSHLSETTWILISVKMYHFNRMRHVRRAARIGLLRALYQAWRDPQRAHANAAPWLRLCDRQIAIHSFQHSKAFQDDATYYANLAAAHGGVEADEGITGLWRSLKPLLPRQQAKRRSNIRCRGPGHLELAQHYCNLEGGVATSYPQLLHECHARQVLASSESPLQVPLQDMPSRQDMELIFQQFKRGKSLGLMVSRLSTRRPCLIDMGISSMSSTSKLGFWLLGQPSSKEGSSFLSQKRAESSRPPPWEICF